MSEHLVKFRVIKLQDRTAVIELCLLVSASECHVRRMRIHEGMAINLSFDSPMKGDEVLAITDETRAVIRKARSKHEAT